MAVAGHGGARAVQVQVQRARIDHTHGGAQHRADGHRPRSHGQPPGGGRQAAGERRVMVPKTIIIEGGERDGRHEEAGEGGKAGAEPNAMAKHAEVHLIHQPPVRLEFALEDVGVVLANVVLQRRLPFGEATNDEADQGGRRHRVADDVELKVVLAIDELAGGRSNALPAAHPRLLLRLHIARRQLAVEIRREQARKRTKHRLRPLRHRPRGNTLATLQLLQLIQIGGVHVWRCWGNTEKSAATNRL